MKTRFHVACLLAVGAATSLAQGGLIDFEGFFPSGPSVSYVSDGVTVMFSDPSGVFHLATFGGSFPIDGVLFPGSYNLTVTFSSAVDNVTVGNLITGLYTSEVDVITGMAYDSSNNLLGTKSIADASVAAGVSRFVMISSDKAVNPTSVMGATKRLAELYVQWLHRQTLGGRTKMSMVRFGNVLGSRGSLVPILRRQIAHGGPVTVTHPEMTRYSMTIPEAAALIVQASAFGDEGQVFVLDMGEPVSILELARRDSDARIGAGKDIESQDYGAATGGEDARGALVFG